MLGESQRAVSKLFHDTLPEIAARRPHTVVLIDEVEALAVRRSSASFETNPVDVHRATDAVLAGLDALRARCPHVVLIVTTNFLQAVDEAVLSRADLVLTTELPNAETIEGIVHGSLEELAGQWQSIRPLAEDKALHAELASLLVGIDGRRVRKTVLSALASRTEVAMEPGLVAADDLRCAAQFSSDTGPYPPRQRPGIPVRQRQWLSPHGVSSCANNLQRITVDGETNGAAIPRSAWTPTARRAKEQPVPSWVRVDFTK